MAYRAARKAHGRMHKANGGAHKARNGTLGRLPHTARGTRKCGISFFTFRYRISTVFLRRVFCRFSRAKKYVRHISNYVRHISNYVRHILKYKAHIFSEVPCRYNSLKTSFRFSVPYLSVTGSGLHVAARVPPQRIECRKRQGTKKCADLHRQAHKNICMEIY